MTEFDRFRLAWLNTLLASLVMAGQRILNARDDDEAVSALVDMGYILRRIAHSLEP